MSNGCPCRGCRDRTEVCHAECEPYAEWKRVNDEKKAVERQKRQAAQTLSSAAIKHIISNIKRGR